MVGWRSVSTRSVGTTSRLPRSLSKISLTLSELNPKDTLEYRVQPVDHDQHALSLWHDVPLVADEAGHFNYINEIPKCSRKKYEIATKEAANPIKQDEKKGTLREFKKGDIYFNYGCFPRTWEDPNFVHPDAGVGGDNDPLDVCEIGLRQIGVGEVVAVKVLGVLCMIDDGEADWKVVAIDANDRWAPELNDVEDVERLLPGTLDLIREWFRTYKIPDGKPPNVFGLEERFMPAQYALSVIDETHHAWMELIKNHGMANGLSVPDMGTLDPVSIRDDGEIIRNLSGNNLAEIDKGCTGAEDASMPEAMEGVADEEPPSF